MRAVKSLLLAAGVVGLGYLVYRIGAGPLVDALSRLAWWQFVLVCLPYGLTSAVDTLGWRFAFSNNQPSYWRLFGARLAGEALNIVTAVGSVGGEAVKAWLIRRDVTYEESVPSVVIAKTTIVIAQAIFLVLGLAIAWLTLPGDSSLLSGMLWLLAIEIVAVGGFVGAQVTGLIGRMGRLLARVGVVAAPEYAEQLDRTLRDYYHRERNRFTLSVAFHTLGWLFGALEAFVTLWALGMGANPLAAIVIEAFGSGVRFASFMVPASLGVFEGANAGAFSAIGYGAAAGLAFSLVRRARQMVWIGIGVLALVWMRWSDSKDEARHSSVAA